MTVWSTATLGRFSKKLSLSPFTLQVGALNACFLAKRGFNVEVFEAREGSIQNSLYNLFTTALSRHLRFLDIGTNIKLLNSTHEGWKKDLFFLGIAKISQRLDWSIVFDFGQISGKPKLWRGEASTWLCHTEVGKHWSILGWRIRWAQMF